MKRRRTRSTRMMSEPITGSGFTTRQVTILVLALLLTIVIIPAGARAAQVVDAIITDPGGTNQATVDPDGNLHVAGEVTVDGNVGISGTPDVNIANSSVPASQSGAWNVGIEGTPTVRPGVPSQPFWDSGSLTLANPFTVVGGTASFIGLTSITVTNFDFSTPAQVRVQNGITTESNCSGSLVGGSSPNYSILVAPRATVHLDFPTPAVFFPVSPSGAEPSTDTCIRLDLNSSINGSVAVAVNGFTG